MAAIVCCGVPAVLALCAAAAFGVADFLGGFATRRSPVVPVTVVSNLTGALVALGVLAVIGGEWTTASAVLGGVGGLAGLVGLVLLYDALASGRFQLVSPISAVTGAAVPVVAGLVIGDRPGVLAIVGLLLTAPAVWLLAGGAGLPSRVADVLGRRLLLQSFLAGGGFGVFFVFLDRTPDGAGATPLVAARVASIAAIVLLGVARGGVRPAASAVPSAAAAGAVDMTANGFFLWASRDGDLSVVGALTSLYPAGTVVLAWLVFGERLRRLQRIGLALALGAAALLSV